MAHFITEWEGWAITCMAKSFVGPLVTKGFIGKDDMPDFVQDLAHEVIVQIERHDFTVNAGTLKTFSFRVMENHVFQLKRNHRSPGNRMIKDAVPLDAVTRAEDTDDIPQYAYAEAALCGEPAYAGSDIHAVREFLNTLDEESLSICRGLMEGKRVSEIAAELGLTRGCVRWRMKQIRSRMEYMGF